MILAAGAQKNQGINRENISQASEWRLVEGEKMRPKLERAAGKAVCYSETQGLSKSWQVASRRDLQCPGKTGTCYTNIKAELEPNAPDIYDLGEH